jgi:L-amino acid N-acyltransferase YncA
MTSRPEVTTQAAAAITVERMEPRHAPGVLGVYAEGIASGVATFETAVPTWEDFDGSRMPDHRFVAVLHDLPADLPIDPPTDPTVHPTATEPLPEVLGWVTVSRVSPRAAYAGVVEHSVYVAGAARGRGVGGALMRWLVESCDAGGIWTIQSGVLAENAASLALHERFGFRRVGVRERIGRRDGRWRDVVLLERRSAVVGVES